MIDESALRSAVVQGRFAEAQAHLDDYCRKVGRELQTLPAGCSEAAEIADRASRLLEWARHTTLAGQAQVEEQLRQLRSVRRYRAAGPRARIQTWGLEA